MKKVYILLIFLFSLVTSFAVAAPQYTSITVTLVDGQGQVWANAAFSASIVAPFGNPAQLTNNGTPPISPVSGFADGSGTFSISLDDNIVLTPSGSTWNFTICPNASVGVCINSIQVVHGNTMNLSSSISADLLPIAVASKSPIPRAYSDSEVSGGQGALYWRTTDNTLRGNNGSSWITVGGGGGGGGSGTWNSLTNPIGNLSLNMGNFTTQFNMGSATSSAAGIDISDGTSNSGTGYLLRIWTGTSSNAKAVAFCDNGTTSCVEFNGSAILQALGSAQIVATSVLNTGAGVGGIQLGSNGSGGISAVNTVKVVGNSNKLYASENAGTLSKILLGGQVTCGVGSVVQAIDVNGAVTCFNSLGGNNTYSGNNFFTGTNLMGIVEGIIIQEEAGLNTDTTGILSFTASTTSTSYTFGFGSTHNCSVSPITDPGANRVWISSSGATLQLTASAAITAGYSYVCIGQATF